MAIDTQRKRESALVDLWAVLLPDGSIDTQDRSTLLGQYNGISPAATVIIPPPPDDFPSDARLYDSAGRRKYLPDTWIVGKSCELRERGGYGTGSLEVLATWEDLQALGITGTEYVDLYLYGQRVYRGRIRQPEWHIDSPEAGTLNLVGLVETADAYIVDARYAYSTDTDLSEYFERIVTDWAHVAGKLPNLVIESEVIGVSIREFDAKGKTLAQALNALCDVAPNQCIWGFDVDDSGQDRCYLRTRPTTAAYYYTVGNQVEAFQYPRDTGAVVNRVRLSGGTVKQKNEVTNGSFESPKPASETVGNMLSDYSFETGSGWTLINGATIQDSGSALVQNATARTGNKLLEIDTPGEEAKRTVAADYSVRYVAACYARRETLAIDADLEIWVEGLDAGNNIVVTSGAIFPSITGTTWLRYENRVDFRGYPTVTQLRVRFRTTKGNEANTGTLVDDAGLWERDSAAQDGWNWKLNGSATRLAMDWANRDVTPQEGGWCLKAQAGLTVPFPGSSAVTPTDSLEIYQARDSWATIQAGQTYTLGVWTQNNSAGQAMYRLGVRVYKNDGTLDATYMSANTMSGNAAWTLATLQFTVSSNAAYAEVFLLVGSGPATYFDAMMLVMGDLPYDYQSGKAYWETDTFTCWLDTETSGLTGLNSGADTSQATYGVRERSENNSAVTDWDAASAFGVGYFNAYATPPVQASMRTSVSEAAELLGFDGSVKLVNLPSAPDPLFPSRIRYTIDDSVHMEADLGNERPSLAQLLRLTEERARSPIS